MIQGFPGGTVVKNSYTNAGDPGDVGSIPGSGRSPGGGNGNLLQYSCLENSMDKRSLMDYSPWGHKESDIHNLATGQQQIYNIYYNILYMLAYGNLGEGNCIILPAAAAAELLQSCPTLCNPIDSSPPGSPVPGILQARTLEWVAISFSNA